MAQTGYTPISIYYSATGGNTPTAGNLVAGELAINTADGKMFYKDSAGVVQVIGTKGGVGSSTTTQVLYNSSGLVVGSANMTFSGTALTLANDASISGLTVGKGGGAVASNTAIGQNALTANTSGNNNAALSYNALLSNTTGSNNAAAGLNALYSNTSGSANTSFGRDSLLFNTTASNNTAVGYQAGYSQATNNNNVYLGYQAGYANTNGGNTFLGYQAGNSATTGYNNTFVGLSAGTAVTTGIANTILGGYSGNQGGLDIRTASNYIVLSDGAGNPRLTCDSSGNFLLNGTQVGQSGAFATYQSNGSSAYNTQLFNNYVSGTSYYMEFIKRVSGANTQVGSIQYNGTLTVYATTSDYRLKENVKPMVGALATVAQLKPVTYDWIENKVNGQGFIAHELQAVIPDAVVGVKDAVDSEGNPQYQQIDTSVLVATLVSAIQELKAEIDSLKQQLGK